LGDGGHLFLRIDRNHNRRWVFIYALHGRDREISLGTFPALSLAEARKRRDEMNSTLVKGDPLKPSARQKDAETFGAVARELIKRRSSSWKGGSSAHSWAVTLEQHCERLLNMPIAAIGNRRRTSHPRAIA
jgi:hypothetical protein